MAYPLIYPALEWLLGIGATGAGVAASNNEEVPVSSWSLHDNPVGRGLHWLFDPKWGGFATAMTYSPTTIERMPDGSYFGYQSWNNPDGTFGSEIRPNTLGTVEVMSRPRYSVISSRLYDEAPTDSVGSAPVPIDTIGTPQPAPVQPTTGNTTSSESTASSASPEPERNDNTSSKLRRLLWETSKNSPKSSRIGRNLRNFGLRVPIYGTAANWGIPTIGNTVSFINTGKAPIKWPLTSYIPGVFDTDSATNQPKTLVPVLVNGLVYYVDPSQNTLATLLTDTIKAVTTNLLPDSTITNQGDDFEQWLKSRQTE